MSKDLIVAEENTRNLHRASLLAGTMKPHVHNEVVVNYEGGIFSASTISTDNPEALKIYWWRKYLLAV